MVFLGEEGFYSVPVLSVQFHFSFQIFLKVTQLVFPIAVLSITQVWGLFPKKGYEEVDVLFKIWMEFLQTKISHSVRSSSGLDCLKLAKEEYVFPFPQVLWRGKVVYICGCFRYLQNEC